MPLPKPLLKRIRVRAQYRCEYCHYPEFLSTAPLSIDHIQPRSIGGTDDFDNLALACRRCNERRYNFTHGIDPQTGIETSLFNPRKQNWSEHFIWSEDGSHIVGMTSIGRATCNRMDLNDERRSDKFIQRSRKQWTKGGFHPPEEDPQQN